MILMKADLLYSILREGDSDSFLKYARSVGAGGATVFFAKGTASNVLLRALGLGTKMREVVLILTDEKKARQITELATEDEKIEGVSILIGDKGEKIMDKQYKMITVIVNSGYAEDVMVAARKAGATGGTVTLARGTAVNDGSDKFFGVVIVPEKEMISIVAEVKDAEKIVNEIMNLECLKAPGSGIIYTQDVKEFINLGQKNS